MYKLTEQDEGYLKSPVTNLLFKTLVIESESLYAICVALFGVGYFISNRLHEINILLSGSKDPKIEFGRLPCHTQHQVRERSLVN